MSETRPGRRKILEAMAHTGLSILRGIERGEEAEVSARLD